MASPVILLEQIKNQAASYVKNTFFGDVRNQELKHLDEKYKELEDWFFKTAANPAIEEEIKNLKANHTLEIKNLKKEIGNLNRTLANKQGVINKYKAWEKEGFLKQKQRLTKLNAKEQNQKKEETIQPIFSKPTRMRLRGSALKQLYLEVVERDEGHCRICEGKGVQAHHILYGSKKEDVLDNLLLVCGNCHSKVHAHLLSIEPYLSQSQIAYIALKNKQNNVREVV